MAKNSLIWPPPYLEDWRVSVRSDKAPQWLLEPLIPMDANVWITGKPKQGKKTTFVFGAIRALASGRPFADFKPTFAQGINVAVLELEGSRFGTEKHFGQHDVGSGYDVPNNRITFLHRYPLLISHPPDVKRLCALIDERKIGLLVIDSLAKSLDGDENSSKDMNRYFRAIDAIRAHGTSVAYIDHLHKPKDVVEDIDDEGRGSSVKAGFYDVHLAFRPDGKKLILKVRSRDGAELLYRVNWEFTDAAIRCAVEKFDPDVVPDSSILQACLDVLEPGKVYTYKALQTIWSVPSEVVNQTLTALLASGTLNKTAKGFKAAGG